MRLASIVTGVVRQGVAGQAESNGDRGRPSDDPPDSAAVPAEGENGVVIVCEDDSLTGRLGRGIRIEGWCRSEGRTGAYREESCCG